MNLVVLVKQVPDTTEIKIDAKTGNLIREGVESIINPDDLYGLATSLELKKDLGGKITAISMGPPSAIDAVSEALGMGIDEGILLTDKLFAGADTWATSRTLARAIEKAGEYDLVICGRQAIDGDTAQVGPQVAEFLGIPQLTYVIGIESVDNNKIVVRRALEHGYQKVESDLPALITVVKGICTPCYARADLVFKACRENAPIKVWNAADLGFSVNEIGLAGSLTNVIKTFSPKMERDGKILQGSIEEAVGRLMDQFRENHLI